MCRGIQEQANQTTSFFCSSREHVSSHHMNSSSSSSSGFVPCELCGSRACLYCQADDAYLCRKCDKWVHEANFLALRHVRCCLCNSCQKLTKRYLVGASAEVMLPTILRWIKSRRCDPKVQVRNRPTNIPQRTFQFL